MDTYCFQNGTLHICFFSPSDIKEAQRVTPTNEESYPVQTYTYYDIEAMARAQSPLGQYQGKAFTLNIVKAWWKGLVVSVGRFVFVGRSASTCNAISGMNTYMYTGIQDKGCADTFRQQFWKKVTGEMSFMSYVPIPIFINVLRNAKSQPDRLGEGKLIMLESGIDHT